MRLENSFILAPGVGEKTEKKLWSSGVTHWDGMSDCEILGSKKRTRLESFIDKARKNLEVENTVFFEDKLPNSSLWRMYENFSEGASFFDIETTGLDPQNSKVTTLSIHRGGSTETLVRGEDLTSDRLRQEMFDSSVLVSFNGKRFDQPFLEDSFGMDIQTPHIDLMYLCRRVGATGGLKKVERDLGVERELEDIDGREAINLWKSYERNGDLEARDKLVRYNRYDARNLKEVLEKVRSELEKEIFSPHVDENF